MLGLIQYKRFMLMGPNTVANICVFKPLSLTDSLNYDNSHSFHTSDVNEFMFECVLVWSWPEGHSKHFEGTVAKILWSNQ